MTEYEVRNIVKSEISRREEENGKASFFSFLVCAVIAGFYFYIADFEATRIALKAWILK